MVTYPWGWILADLILFENDYLIEEDIHKVGLILDFNDMDFLVYYKTFL
jgi:hypothetical protein